VNAYNIVDRTDTTRLLGLCNVTQPATVIGSPIYRW